MAWYNFSQHQTNSSSIMEELSRVRVHGYRNKIMAINSTNNKQKIMKVVK